MPDAVEPSPRDAGLWREHARLLAWAGELRETVLAARHDDDAAQLLVVAAERAALASLDGTAEARALAWDALREGAACGAAAALCASRTEGAALVRLADGRSRAFAVGGHAGMSAPRWALALALASCCGDGEAQRVLTHPRAVLACQEPTEVADAFWTPYCAALAALLRGEAAAAGLLRDALAALAQPCIADPAFVAQTREPVLRLALCLAEGGAGTAQALDHALAAHARWYGEGPGRGERLGLLAFELAGLCALARRQGVTLETDSPLLLPLLAPPPAGGQGEAAGQGQDHPGLEFVFAPRRVLDDGEPHWFLDLMGFPRAGRRHQVGTLDGGALVADYTAEGAPGLPRSRARFALPGEGLPHTGWPPALTAVQLHALHAALLEAARGADAPTAAALRDEATDIEAAIARHGQAPGGEAKAANGSPIPAQTTGGSAPPQAGEGEAAAADATAPHGTQAARAVALAAAAAVSAQLQPLLEALGQDRDGALAASLRPRAGDYARAFAPAVADAARDAYEALWAEPPRVRLAAAGSRLVCHVAPAGLLGGANELSRPFPGGYRRVAGLLDPHRVWVAWKLLPPGQDAGMAYDGLVWLDDHWAWFPKPYRVLAHLAAPPASA